MTQESGKPESENAEDGKPETEAQVPEVEAEIVEETDGASSAFDETSPEIEEALAAAEEELAPKKSTLTPGVLLFFAFVAVALVAFFIWWRQSGDEPRAVEEATESAPAESEQAETELETTGPSAPPVEEEPAPETPPSSLPEPSGKIANEPKTGLRPPDESTPDEPFLPPVSERGAKKIANTIEAGAEEASRRIGEPEEETAPAEGQQTDEVAQGEAPPTEDSIPEEQTEEAAPPIRPSEAEQAEAASDAPEFAGDIPAKIVNDLEMLRNETERLESALAEERARNADLATEIAELRQAFEAALAARDQRYDNALADMQASLQKIQNSEIKGATDQLRANLALSALRRKVDAGEPFAEELTAVAAFAPDRAAALAPYAHSGAPTHRTLQESFGAAARAGLAAAGQQAAGGGVSGVIARAKSLVSVRPAEPQAGDSPRAVISRAEHAVEEGDLTYALSEIDSLPASAKEAMADWIGKAQARAETQSALSALSAQLNGNGSE